LVEGLPLWQQSALRPRHSLNTAPRVVAVLFWIVKHGMRMTGMPSFGAIRTDEEFWSIVAFIEKPPKMTPDQYQEMKQRSRTDTREHTHSP
jgi:mono/diheme cytochrome c family protein